MTAIVVFSFSGLDGFLLDLLNFATALAYGWVTAKDDEKVENIIFFTNAIHLSVSQSVFPSLFLLHYRCAMSYTSLKDSVTVAVDFQSIGIG